MRQRGARDSERWPNTTRDTNRAAVVAKHLGVVRRAIPRGLGLSPGEKEEWGADGADGLGDWDEGFGNRAS